MAKLTLNNVTSGYQSSTASNANNDLIEAAVENTLSRDGTSPNQMGADLDMNSNDVLNAGQVSTENLVLGGVPYPGGTVAVTNSDTAPSNPVGGQFWWKSDVGRLYVYHTDDDSSQWVETGGYYSTTAPTDSGDVPHTPAGTGAVATTVESRLNEIISVKDFGATGDGTTDDTDAIQLAITAAGANGSLFFPDGTYIISDDDDSDGVCLTQLDGQTWFGNGPGSSIIRVKATAASFTTAIETADNAQDYTFRDLQIDGNRDNITPTTDLYTTYRLLRGPSNGKNGTYENLILSNSWGRVLETGAESETITEGVRVHNVTVLNAGTKAIEVMNSKKVTVSDCYVEVNAYTDAENNGSGAATSGSCFEVAGSTDVTIANNHGKHTDPAVFGPGIRLINSSAAIEVHGNTIEGASYLGFIQNVNDVHFNNNIGRDIQGNAILIADSDTSEPTTKCQRIWVNHNTIIDTDDAYVYITANKSGYDAYVQCFVHNNNFVQSSGSPTYGFYNTGVVSPATGGECLVYEWDNTFTGTIPNHLGGTAAGVKEIQSKPNSGWVVLEQSGVNVDHTGDTAETNLALVTIPGHSMGANGRLK